MSIEEYFNSEMYRAKDELSSIITEDTIDWVRFDRVLSSLPNINAIYDRDTILSELYHECPDGKVLVDITKRFLAKGYDVNANEGLNGSQCLHNLSWATFDKYILDAAKLLLEAGARTDIPLDADSDESEGKGIKASISWRLGGDWVEGDYTIANIFEAYWEIVEAFEAGKDYHLICGFEDCMFCHKDGTESVKQWKDRSRAESWTPEMRAVASMRTKQMREAKRNGNS